MSRLEPTFYRDENVTTYYIGIDSEVSRWFLLTVPRVIDTQLFRNWKLGSFSRIDKFPIFFLENIDIFRIHRRDEFHSHIPPQ